MLPRLLDTRAESRHGVLPLPVAVQIMFNISDFVVGPGPWKGTPPMGELNLVPASAIPKALPAVSSASKKPSAASKSATGSTKGSMPPIAAAHAALQAAGFAAALRFSGLPKIPNSSDYDSDGNLIEEVRWCVASVVWLGRAAPWAW